MVGVQFNSSYFREYSLKLRSFHTVADNSTFQNGLISTAEIDRSFKQSDYSISLEAKLDFKIVHELGVHYSISLRNYISTNDGDALHEGRSHTENKVRIWIGDKLNNDVDYTLQFSKRMRKTDATVDWIEELKDFTKLEVTLLFSYHFTSDILY